jgi:hypothetical protein
VPKETRSEALDRIAAEGFDAGLSLPDTRKLAAKKLGGTPNLYLGTIDPRYYRLAGLATPLPDAPASKPYVLRDGKLSASLARAVRVRRDEGVRWNVLAASVEATVGRRVSETVLRGLYAKGGGDLATSYAGRGTLAGVPTLRENRAEEARGSEA